jgi:DNA mismatch endonuclease (patch repair protein)
MNAKGRFAPHPGGRSANMRSIRSKDTAPEKAVRRLLRALGYAYRLHDRRLPGTPDIVLRRQKKVIFVNGCFWHQHPDPACKAARLPSSNPLYWHGKLWRNRERDVAVRRELARLGWQHLDIWECELRDVNHLSSKLLAFLDNPIPDYLLPG